MQTSNETFRPGNPATTTVGPVVGGEALAGAVRLAAGMTPAALIAAFWGFTAAALAARLGPALVYAFPAAGLVAAALLLRRSMGHYAVLVWTLWCFTPFVRRVVDYQAGWNPLNPVVLTPLLATALAGVFVLRPSVDWRSRRARPFLLVFAAIVYGFGVGVGKNGFVSPTFDLLGWSAPPLFAFYLAGSGWGPAFGVHARGGGIELSDGTPRARRLLVDQLLPTAAAVMGVYAIIQVVSPPAWDRAWMVNAQVLSIGPPEPFRLRAFATMNSPGPFAIVLMTVLLLLPAARGRLKGWAVALAAAGMLLSLVRSAWLGYAAGALFASVAGPQWARRRAVGAVAIVAGVCAAALAAAAPLSGELGRRFSTFADPLSDVSLIARAAFHRERLSDLLTDPVGAGLGRVGTSVRLHSGGAGESRGMQDFDSGVMKVPFVLGWPGTLLYACGVGNLATRLAARRLRAGRPDDAAFAWACAAAVAALGVQMFFTSVLDGVQGMALWTVIGLGLSGGGLSGGGAAGGHADDACPASGVAAPAGRGSLSRSA